MLCMHLRKLEAAILAAGIEETFRGQPWSKNCREWVYFDCVLDLNEARAQFDLPESVVPHINDDQKSGREMGLWCQECHDGIIGRHELDRSKKTKFP